MVYGYPERDGDAVYNSAQLLSAQGERLANYRKTHLFGDLDRDQFSPAAIRWCRPISTVSAPAC